MTPGEGVEEEAMTMEKTWVPGIVYWNRLSFVGLIRLHAGKRKCISSPCSHLFTIRASRYGCTVLSMFEGDSDRRSARRPLQLIYSESLFLSVSLLFPRLTMAQGALVSA